jgi:GNAT superfamily N-acetyltransferase
VSHIHIRPALTSEKEALEALQLRASLNNPGDREAMLAHPEAIELPFVQLAASCVFVAECDGDCAGFAVVLPRPDGQSELDGLFVDPPFWRRGIGRSLVEYSAAFARRKGASVLHVIGNPHAEDFYRACGFHFLQTVETPFGVGLRFSLAL